MVLANPAHVICVVSKQVGRLYLGNDIYLGNEQHKLSNIACQNRLITLVCALTGQR